VEPPRVADQAAEVLDRRNLLPARGSSASSRCGAACATLLYSRTMHMGLLALLATVACLPIGDHPTTWDERYAKATDELKAADSELLRFYALNEAAKAAFEVGKADEAKQHAQAALALAPKYRGDWNYGNAIHDGHMVLGRVALKSGDVEIAKRELLLAGATPGSPQLDSFGPNMTLAKDLLEQKQSDAVMEYFTLCAKFWDLERGNLRRWSVLAKAGEMPDFGANLLY
jgi:tetratricopeptide (TPR) repeat protein